MSRNNANRSSTNARSRRSPPVPPVTSSTLSIRNPERSLGVTYQFIQTLPHYTIAQSSLTSSVGSYSFTLSSLTQAATFTGLFDQYRVEEIMVTLSPMFRANALATPVGSTLIPFIYTVVDLDDDAAPALLTDLLEYNTCQTHSDEQSFSFTFRPKVAVSTYTGGVSGYIVTNGWIDCANTAVKHYGWKHAVTPAAFAQTALQVWNVSTRVRLSFKNVR